MRALTEREEPPSKTTKQTTVEILGLRNMLVVGSKRGKRTPRSCLYSQVIGGRGGIENVFDGIR